MPDVSTVVKNSLGRISLDDVIAAGVTLLICLVVVRLLLNVIRRLLRRTKLEKRMRHFVMTGFRVLFYTLTVVFTAGSLGIDMTSLVALLSVGSLGVTLAAEDVLGNVAGGLVILSSHPFTIGDFIEVDGVNGTVEDININHTRLTTPDGLTALLPNKEVASSKVVNYTSLGRRRITRKISASYDAPTETVKAACFRALASVDGILDDPAPTVFLTEFGGSGIEYTVYCWVQANDFWPLQFALSEAMRAAFDEVGIEIPCNRVNVQMVQDGPKG